MTTTSMDHVRDLDLPPAPVAPGLSHGRLLDGVADSSAMVGRSLRHVVRNIDSLVMAVVLPVMILVLFVYVFGGAMSTEGDYIDYVVPGIILLCASFGSASTAVSVSSDMANGIIDRFRSLPIASGAVLTGHVVASLVRNFVATAVVVGVGVLMGFRPTAGPAEWVAALGLLTLFIVAISWVSVCLGLLAGSAEAANGLTFAFLFLPYVSSAFVPTDTMPGWLHGFAQHQPVTPVIEAVRGLLMGAPVGSSGWLSIAWFGGIIVVAYVAARVLFTRRTVH